MGRTAAGRGTAATAGMTAGITFRNHDMGNGLIDQMIRIGRKAETAVCPIGFSVLPGLPPLLLHRVAVHDADAWSSRRKQRHCQGNQGF